MDDSSLAVGRLLKKNQDPHRRERMIRQIVARRRMPQERKVRLVLAVATAVVLIAGICFLWLSRGDDVQAEQSIALQSGAALELLEVQEKASKSASYRLSDGSTIVVHPGSSLRPMINDGKQLSFVLVKGAAVFNVVPSQRRWVIDAGHTTVEVLGTQFEVNRSDREVVVRVERGTVRVRSEHLDGSQRLVHFGEMVRVASPELEPSPQPELQAQENVQLSEDEPTEEPTPERRSRPWSELANNGDYSGAYGQLGPEGFSSQVSRARSIEELLLLADVARLSGHPRAAVTPLERAIAEYPGHRRAAVAAFTLGRIHVDVLGSPSQAVRAFERCLALGPPGALYSNALARLAEARAQSGDRTGARRAAQEYLDRFPNGLRANYLREHIIDQ